MAPFSDQPILIKSTSNKNSKKENPFLSLGCNIFLPVIILQKLSSRLGDNGPLYALLLALAFPLGYATWDYFSNKHKNYLSLFGLVSVLVTGGFALLKLQGQWFVIKEALFPALLALGVAITGFTQKPLVETLFCNDQLFNFEMIFTKLNQNNSQHSFRLLIRNTTFGLAGSFLVSSVLNYYLASKIFLPIDDNLSQQVKANILNDQIAKMTGSSFLAIAIPMMFITGLVLWYFIHQLCKLTGYKLEQIIRK
ncbi:MAG: hypothetical protein K1X29_03155 [Bdellovibrionales bacterium]|nr:hypothetical protein [Bdellovibrionales bacterium]